MTENNENTDFDTESNDTVELEDSQESEATTDSDEVSSDNVRDDEEHHAKKTNWAQKRINELTAEKYALKRERDEIAQRTTELQKYVEAIRGEEESPQQGYDIDKLVQQEAQRLIQQERFNEKCEDVYAKGKSQYEDFDESIADLGMIDLSMDFLDIVADADNAEKILYHLANNLDEAQRISRLPPAKMGREIGKLEKKFESSHAVKRVSNAPAPIKGLHSKVSATKHVSEMTDAEYAKWRLQGL